LEHFIAALVVIPRSALSLKRAILLATLHGDVFSYQRSRVVFQLGVKTKEVRFLEVGNLPSLVRLSEVQSPMHVYGFSGQLD